jgi:hypothetical protein
MQNVSRAVAALLLSTLAIVPLAAQVALLTAPHAKPAGCHQHEHPSPVPPSTNYSCCKAGHSTALLQEAFTLRIACLQILPLAHLLPARVISNTINQHRDLSFDALRELIPLRI